MQGTTMESKRVQSNRSGLRQLPSAVLRYCLSFLSLHELTPLCYCSKDAWTVVGEFHSTALVLHIQYFPLLSSAAARSALQHCRQLRVLHLPNARAIDAFCCPLIQQNAGTLQEVL